MHFLTKIHILGRNALNCALYLEFNGFDYSIGNTSVSYDEVISYLRQNVEDNGYNDVQAYITLKRNFKGSVADEVVGRDISKEEINKEAKKAYENGIVDTKEEGVSHGR